MSTVPVRPRGANQTVLSIDPTAEPARGSAELGRCHEEAGAHPPPSEDVAVDVSDVELMSHAPHVRRTLLSFGVVSTDLDGVTQNVMLGAWRAIQAGRFRPRRGLTPQHALRVWLFGIAFRQSSHHRDTAHRRREIPMAEPSATTGDAAGVSPEGKLAAGSVLRALRRLPPELQDVLAMVAVGANAAEIAEALGILENTVYSRLRRGRAALARALTRWRSP